MQCPRHDSASLLLCGEHLLRQREATPLESQRCQGRCFIWCHIHEQELPCSSLFVHGLTCSSGQEANILLGRVLLGVILDEASLAACTWGIITLGKANVDLLATLLRGNFCCGGGRCLCGLHSLMQYNMRRRIRGMRHRGGGRVRRPRSRLKDFSGERSCGRARGIIPSGTGTWSERDHVAS